MYRMFATVLVAAFLADTAGAQTASPAGSPAARVVSPVIDAFSLDQALKMGGVGSARPSASSSPSVAAATAGVDAATAARRVASLRPNPELQAQVENIVGTGGYSGLDSAETTVGMALPLELGGKRPARVALATARLTRAQIQVEVARADLRLRISQLYIAAVAAERRADVLGKQAAIAADLARIAGDRVQTGDIGPIEQQRADILRINAQVAADSALRHAGAARVTLATLLGSAIEGALDRGWFDRIDDYGPQRPVEPETMLAIVAAQADVRAADAQVRVAQSLRMPDLTVSTFARRFEATKDTAAVVGIAIPLPFFNNGSAFVGQARSEQTQAIALRTLAAIDARQAIFGAQTDLANAAATARAVGGPGLAAAQEAARIARIGWVRGKFDQIALLDAERTLSQTRLTHVDALAAYHDAQARLDRLTTPAPATFGDER